MNFVVKVALVAVVAFAGTNSASADTVLSWDAFANGASAADATSSGFTGALSGAALRDTRSNNGSQDGTFGTLAAGANGAAASATVGQMRLNKWADGQTELERTLTASITNNSGDDWELDGVYFDMTPNFTQNGNTTAGSYDSWEVRHNGTVLGSGTFTAVEFGNADNPFAGIAIADGATVFLDIVFSAVSETQTVSPSTIVDNIAFTATEAGGSGPPQPVDGQTFNVTRVDGRPGTAVLDPVIDESTFAAVNSAANNNAGSNNSTGPHNLNGPSVIRVPDWIDGADRVNPNANYYMYFGHHAGRDIRMAWSDSLTGDWTMFNAAPNGSSNGNPNATDQAWGVNGNNTGAQTPGHGVLTMSNGQLAASNGSDVVASNHISSPDVLVDHVNQRIVMYFHATTQFTGGPGQGTGQVSWVSTSENGLNFNPTDAGGEPGQGMREVVTTRAYSRSFEVSGQTFAFTNVGELWKAPATNDAGQANTIANADSEGGLWNPSGTNTTASWWTKMDNSDNPLAEIYGIADGDDLDVRHPHAYTRTHLDPSDTNVYLFYSAREDTPEAILLSVIDTDNGSTDTSDWAVLGFMPGQGEVDGLILGQELILRAEDGWEGGQFDPTIPSSNGAAFDANQLRDPYLFEDDGELYLFYTGQGEEAIGFAKLTFASLGLAGDFDLSGTVDCADLDGYVGNIGAAADGELATLDIDGNGTLDASDADTHISTLVTTSNGVVGTFPGDVNCDGQVNVLGDAFTLIANLNNAITSYADGDINFDGTVNVLGDAFVLIGNLGMSNDP